MTCFDQQNVVEVTLCDFQAYALSSFEAPPAPATMKNSVIFLERLYRERQDQPGPAVPAILAEATDK